MFQFGVLGALFGGDKPPRDRASGARTPFEIGAPPFHVWPPGCYIHPILYFKNVAPPVFWPPLLLHPGDWPKPPVETGLYGGHLYLMCAVVDVTI